MKDLFESKNPDRDAMIMALLAEGREKQEIAELAGVSVPTISRVARRNDGTKAHDLVLHDGRSTEIPIARVWTSRGFLHACRMAMREFSGTFNSLELPCWELKDGVHHINVAELKQQDAELKRENAIVRKMEKAQKRAAA